MEALYTPTQPVLSKEAMDRRRARDKRDGLTYLTHVNGLCGGSVGDCCSECYADELAEYLAWAKDQPARNPEETPGDYWRRIGGRFGDAWYEAATMVK